MFLRSFYTTGGILGNNDPANETIGLEDIIEYLDPTSGTIALESIIEYLDPTRTVALDTAHPDPTNRSGSEYPPNGTVALDNIIEYLEPPNAFESIEYNSTNLIPRDIYNTPIHNNTEPENVIEYLDPLTGTMFLKNIVEYLNPPNGVLENRPSTNEIALPIHPTDTAICRENSSECLNPTNRTISFGKPTTDVVDTVVPKCGTTVIRHEFIDMVDGTVVFSRGGGTVPSRETTVEDFYATNTVSALGNIIKNVKQSEGKAIYDCGICGKLYEGEASDTEADMFRQEHTKKHKNQCPKCPKKFLLLEELMDHMRADHALKQYMCNFCGFFSYNLEQFQDHIAKPHETAKFHCKICNRLWSNSKNFKAHVCMKKETLQNEIKIKSILKHSHNQKSYFQCHLCNETTATVFNLNQHMETCLKKNPARKTSENPRDRAAIPKNNIENIDPKKFFKILECKTCGKVYSDTSLNLKAEVFQKIHSKKHKNNCPKCPKKFLLLQELLDHVKTIHTPTEIKCDLCEFRSHNGEHLRDHMATNHGGKMKYRCKMDNRTRNKGSKAHVCKGELGLCQYCGYETKSQSTLKHHVGKHHAERPFQCTLCNKAMMTVCGLRRHLKMSHNNPRPRRRYDCNECGKTFVTKFRLRNHIYTHMGEKPYECSICSFAFTKRPTLRNHLLTHSGKRLYACDLCGKRFTQRSGLCSHRRIHGDVPQQPKYYIDSIIKDIDPKMISDIMSPVILSPP